MKKLMILTALSLVLVGCTDADKASWGTLGTPSEVTCYSGGQEVFKDISTGTLQSDGDGIYYKSQTTGKYVKAFADCIVITQ